MPGGGEGGTLSQSCGPKTGGWGKVSFNPQDLQGLSLLGRLRGRAVSCSITAAGRLILGSWQQSSP